MVALEDAPTRVLWIDDDVTINEAPVSSIVPDVAVTYASLSGCPDYSIAEWMIWTLVLASEEFAKKLVDHGLWRKMPTRDDLRHHEYILRRYTNARKWSCGVSTLDIRAGGQAISPPRGSGSAFITNLGLGQAPLYPPYYSEDIYWLERMYFRTSRKPELGIFSAHHGRPRKDILGVKPLLREELGSLCSRTQGILIDEAYPNIDSTLRALAEDRARWIGRVLRVCMISDLRGGAREVMNTVIANLGRVHRELLSSRWQKQLSGAVRASLAEALEWDALLTSRSQLHLLSDIRERLQQRIGAG